MTDIYDQYKDMETILNPDGDDSIITFDKFWQENKNDIINPKSYPINYKNLRIWCSNQEDKCSKLFALKFSKLFKHIGFKKFFDDLVVMAYDFIISTDYKNDTKNILYIGNMSDKSNIWVSLLIWPYIRSSISKVIYGETELKKFNLVNLNKDYRLLYPDDMSYTGGQIYEFHKRVFSSIKKKDMVLLIPYITNSAILKLHDLPIKLLDTITIIPTFAEYFGDNDQKCLDEFVKQYKSDYALFGFTKDKACVYFDHKVADDISVYRYVMTLGPIFKKGIQYRKVPIEEDDRGKFKDNELIMLHIKPLSLISGITFPEKEYAINSEGWDDETNNNPPPYYKNIKYKNLDLLKLLTY